MTDIVQSKPIEVTVNYAGPQPSSIMSAYRADVTVASDVSANSIVWGALVTQSTSAPEDGCSVAVYAQTYVNGKSSAWGGCSELHDVSGLSNPTTAKIAHEFDVVADGTDDLGNRVAILIVGFQNDYTASQPTIISDAVRVFSAANPAKPADPANVIFTNGVRFFDRYRYCINTQPAQCENGEAIFMARDQSVSFDGHGKLQLGIDPTKGWNVSTSAPFDVPANGSTPLAHGSGMVVVHDLTHDDMAIYLCCGGCAVMQGRPHGAFFVDGVPPPGKVGVAWNGASYSVVNSTNQPVTFNVATVRTS